MRNVIEVLTKLLGHEGALAVIKQSPNVLKSPPGTMNGAIEVLTELLGHEGALALIERSPTVLRSPPGTISGALEVLTELLGHEGALAVVEQNSGLLLRKGDSMRATATFLKGLFDEARGSTLLRNKPRLLQASAKYVSQNFEILCEEFKRDDVLRAVFDRPILLYDRAVTMNAIKHEAL